MKSPKLPINTLYAKTRDSWSATIENKYGHRELWLNIGVQSFRIDVDDEPDAEPERMNWFKEQLEGAMTKMSSKEVDAMQTAENAMQTAEDTMLYNIALQHAIESHCRGEVIPVGVYEQCEFHAKKLNAKLATQQKVFDYAKTLATSLFNKHFAQDRHYASGDVTWSLQSDLLGVLAQIDNMSSNLIRITRQALNELEMQRASFGKCLRCNSANHPGRCTDAKLREAWAVFAAEFHGWSNTDVPPMRDGAFEAGWQELEYKIFVAGVEHARSNATGGAA